VYLQRARVEHAKELLETTNLGVDEVARRLGYSDVPSFRQVFVRHAGLPPRQYRNKYRAA
jgi:transcriptional regulator GlxA family with amidase domain